MQRSKSDKPAQRTDTQESSSLKLGSAVGKINAIIYDGLSTGDLAELRRISPDEPFTPALWRVLLDLELDDAPDWISQSKWERRWATLLMGMARCAGLHSYDIPFGQALAEAGWSELRFVRLMRSDGQQLETELRRLAQYLASKNQRADWTDAGRLLFYQSGDTADDIRLQISRHYYKTLYAKEQQ